MLSSNQKHFDDVLSLDKEMKLSKDKHNMPSSGVTIGETMTSSTQSLSSSLASPGDSGVQLLDSESDMASLMSMSGHDFIDNSLSNKNDENYVKRSISDEDETFDDEQSHRISVILNKDFQIVQDVNKKVQVITQNQLQIDQNNLMTTSDIANQNTTQQIQNWKIYSQSAPPNLMKHSHSDFVEQFIEDKADSTLNETKTENLLAQSSISTNSSPQVAVSENLEANAGNDDVMQTSIITPMADDQIVYRRQRRKKVKSQDAPKKRVSFHEDILNSTKIDDIHIDRGFITRQPCDRFYNEHNGVVLGRYSWAAEGDSSCYNRNNSFIERDIKSDILSNNDYLYPTTAVISNSSSSSMSLEDSSSSSSSSDSSHYGDIKDLDDLSGIINGIQNIKKVPKSSCLKKPKHGVINTKIVHENYKRNINVNNLTRKISESNLLLDTNNLFGSLKNIYKTLSSSVPLAQRGVPEGQEDFTTHSECTSGNNYKRNSYSSNETLYSKSLENSYMNNVHDVVTDPSEIVEQNHQELLVVEHRPVKIYKKPNLRLSRSEGFYPNYPNDQQSQSENIILCDSNVYEHRGISYSYEYDQFQSTFNNTEMSSSMVTANDTKSKGSTLYQMLLDELNFLKKSECNTTTVATTEPSLLPVENKIQQQTINSNQSSTSTPIKKQQTGNNQMSVHSDWSSSTESVSDIYEKSTASSKHLQSPLKKRNLKPNHYSIQKMLMSNTENDLSVMNTDNLTAATLKSTNSSTTSTKTSLINRFLRNVTQRKLFETKFNQQNQLNKHVKNNFLSNLYNIGKIQPNQQFNHALNTEIKHEIDEYYKEKQRENINKKYPKIKEKIIRQTSWYHHQNNIDGKDMFFNIYEVKSAYDMNGDNKPLLLLITNTILFIFSLNENKTEYYNEFMIPLKDVHFILIGPNRQTIYLSNNRRTLLYFIITGDANITTDIISRLEFTIRKYIKSSPLPAIKEFMVNDMAQLRYAIYQQTSVSKDEDFHHYNLIHIEDEQLTSPTKETPLGPYHDGFLMYRKAQTDDRWEFGFFILKAGVLYMFPSPTTRIPLKVIQLYDGECYGVHRTQPRPRPHTFELFTKTESLEFAASDEYEASDWLQMFVQSASGMQITKQQQKQTTACSLILTTDHLVTVREYFNFEQDEKRDTVNYENGGIQTLSCAAISDLTSFKIPSSFCCCDDKQQSWCILEFSCREVRETSGDWILHFSSNFELKKFLTTFEVLWSCSNLQNAKFPLTTINETDHVIYRHASETHRVLQQAWISFQ